MATIPGNATSGLYGIGLGASTPVGNNYGNSNVAAFLGVFQGNMTAGNITVPTGNINGNIILAQQYLWSNGISINDTMYSNLTASQFLPTYSGDINAIITEPTQPFITSIAPQVDLTLAGNLNAQYYAINFLDAPQQPGDAANKAYVDSVAEGLNIHAAVRLATIAPLPDCTYDNGVLGIGATLQGNANGLLDIDNRTVEPGDRVLIKNETLINSPYNGIYICNRNDIGATFLLTRVTDCDTSDNFYGAAVYVADGTTEEGTTWICVNQQSTPIVVGTTPIVFKQFGNTGSLVAGDGIDITASVISIDPNYTLGFTGMTQDVITSANVAANNIIINEVLSTGNVTAGNVITGDVIGTGNITGNYFIGNGALLTGIDSTLISNGNSNVVIATAGGNITMDVGGNSAFNLGNQTVSIGYQAQTPNFNSVSVGFQAGANVAAVAVGSGAGYNMAPLTTAIGTSAGAGDGATFYRGVTAVGYTAGSGSKGNGVVAIGSQAGTAGLDPIKLSELSVLIGNGTGTLGNLSVAVGTGIGQYVTADGNNVAIGSFAAQGNIANYYTPNSAAIGSGAISIGSYAHYNGADTGAIAIGYNAGSGVAGLQSIIIGYQAGVNGVGDNGIAIGTTGAANNTTTIRMAPNTANQLAQYNTATQELSYSGIINIGGNITTTANVSGASLIGNISNTQITTGLGYTPASAGQVWQNFTLGFGAGQRAQGAMYQNTTNSPIQVMIRFDQLTGSNNFPGGGYIDVSSLNSTGPAGTVVRNSNYNNSGTELNQYTVTVTVPPTWWYQANVWPNTSTTVWSELR